MHEMQRSVSCDNCSLRFGTHRDHGRHYRYDHSGRSFWFCASILNVRKPYRCLPHNNEIIACNLCREESQTLLRARFKVLITSVRNTDWKNAYRFSLPILSCTIISVIFIMQRTVYGQKRKNERKRYLLSLNA